MNLQLGWVLLLLLLAVVLFVRNKPRMDVVALLMIVALPLTGVLTVQETLAGFSDPSVVVIAALFVIGEGLVRTGIAYQLGERLMHRAGSSETRLIVLLMLTVAGLGSVMSSTGVVAIFIRSEEHTSELQSRPHLVCRLLLEKKKKTQHKQ